VIDLIISDFADGFRRFPLQIIPEDPPEEPPVDPPVDPNDGGEGGGEQNGGDGSNPDGGDNTGDGTGNDTTDPDAPPQDGGLRNLQDATTQNRTSVYGSYTWLKIEVRADSLFVYN
jgi:hypothetical protein